jgi:hypothetical protein
MRIRLDLASRLLQRYLGVLAALSIPGIRTGAVGWQQDGGSYSPHQAGRLLVALVRPSETTPRGAQQCGIARPVTVGY